MAVESPANIFIVGLNPLSLEAALYGRFLGYRVSVYGHHLEPDWAVSSNPRVDPSQQTTPLGLRAIEAQSDEFDQQALLEGIVDLKSLYKNYVLRLADSDLLCDSITSQCVSVDAILAEDELPEKVDQDVEYDTRVFQVQLEFNEESGQADSDGATESNHPKCDVLIDFRNRAEVALTDHKTDFEVILGIESEAGSSGDDLAEESRISDLQKLITSEPDYYVLGELSLSPDTPFDFQLGMKQIRDLYKILSDRQTLDLYAS